MFLTRDFEILDLSEKEGFQRVAFKFIQFPHILVAVRIQCQRRQTKWRNYYTYGVRKFFLLILKSSSFFRVFTSSLKVLTLKIRFLTITPYSPLPRWRTPHLVCLHVKYCVPFSCQFPFTYCQAAPARMEILQNRDFLFLLTDLCILYREEEFKYHKGFPTDLLNV